MKSFLFIIILLTLCYFAFCQTSPKAFTKPSITPNEFGKFASVVNASITNDGRYAQYIVNDPAAAKSTCTIKSLQSNWEITIPSGCDFNEDSKLAVYKNQGDSLCILTLGTNDTEILPNISSFKLKNNWLAYLLKGTVKKMVVRNLESGREHSFEAISNYTFSSDGNYMALEKVITKNGTEVQSLQWLDLKNNNLKNIWTAENADMKTGGIIFSKNKPSIAFTVESKAVKSIWYFPDGADTAYELANNQSIGVDTSLQFGGMDYRGFTNDGNSLFISLREKEKPKSNPDAVGVDVWSYTDAKLQSQQLKQLKPKTYTASLSIITKKVERLEEHEDEKVISNSDHYALIARAKGDAGYDEWTWNNKIESAVYLVSLSDGKRTLLNDNLPANIATTAYWISPEEKYVIYYDAEKRNYFSYEISTGTRRNITSGIPAKWTTYHKRDIYMAQYMPIYSGGAGWIKGDEAILLYDQCDIFQVDPSGKIPPVNLTGGYGRKQNIEFRIAIESTNQVFEENEKLIVSAFNRNTKEDGFFSIQSGKNKPHKLTMQPCVFKGTWEDAQFIPVSPVKAKNDSVYLVRRMTAEESPNYYWTNDFIKFNRLTDVQPERNYNWLTSVLIEWKTPDGSISQGILYKPENINPNKKYPLIIYYYERYSEGVHGFIMPDQTHGMLNIPYYVSNGYLVFVPDIHYKIGHPGQSVVNAVVSAADHLSKFSFVDAKHIGIQGHSRGGWETNFLITHTNRFAAAMSSSGMSDYIGLYNNVRALGSGISRQTAFENSYQRIGATLWQKPELFIENSPIFNAHRVTTPVLMMANKEDGDVPFEQGVEFFTALRRLGKRAWMLQYDGQGHLVFDKASTDLEIRMKQFFDHYLKGEPAPKWMMYGIPAKDKGVDDGLELIREKDKNGKWVTPGRGLNRQSAAGSRQ